MPVQQDQTQNECPLLLTRDLEQRKRRYQNSAYPSDFCAAPWQAASQVVALPLLLQQEEQLRPEALRRKLQQALPLHSP